MSHRVTSVEEPGQIESTVTGFFLIHVLLFSEYPLLLVMHPLLHPDGEVHSDHVAGLLTPLLIVFLTHSPEWQIYGRNFLHLLKKTGTSKRRERTF